MNNFAELLSYISICSVLIPISVFLFRKKFKNTAITLLFVLLCTSFASDIINELYVRMGNRGAIVYNIYFVIQFILMNYLYALLLKSESKVFSLIVIIYLCYCLSVSLFFQNIHVYQSLTRVVGGICLIAYTFILFVRISKNPPLYDPLTYTPFLINMAVLIYFSFNLVLFAMSNYAFSNLSPKISMQLWMFHNFNNIIKNILFAIGIYHVNKMYMKSDPHQAKLL